MTVPYLISVILSHINTHLADLFSLIWSSWSICSPCWSTSILIWYKNPPLFIPIFHVSRSQISLQPPVSLNRFLLILSCPLVTPGVCYSIYRHDYLILVFLFQGKELEWWQGRDRGTDGDDEALAGQVGPILTILLSINRLKPCDS